MKALISIAKKSINDRDSFVNGFLKGAAGSAILMVVICSIATFH